jgi:hypothetical protein
LQARRPDQRSRPTGRSGWTKIAARSFSGGKERLEARVANDDAVDVGADLDATEVTRNIRLSSSRAASWAPAEAPPPAR